ncbi:MAG: PrsW family intramembrane metalloprotease [Bacteroidales bacterium]|nr:PrsW family intramembrane metalloprotease [Bacteroidales bacterium]MCF8387107.1 PrsW family intramembrane metalloprotease [Bacteroidales bacterium]MCF8397421.1 PrsW family intramembrane metalloprotease [Bacteroidales bacterium]
MSGIDYLSLVISPVVAIALVLYMNYRFQVKSNKHMINAIIFGLISVVLVLAAQILAESFGLDSLRSLKRTAFYSFVIIGFSSELGKFVFLRYYFLPKENFTGPLDGIIYSILIGLGFATTACILLGFEVIGARVNNLYLFLFGAANIVFAIIMGFFVGLGKSRQNRFIDSMTGLFAATFLHGLYAFSFATRDNRLLILFAIGSIVIVILLSAKAIKIKENDKYNMKE